MPFPTRDPSQKLVQLNASIPWSLSVMLDQVATARKQSKSQVVRDVLQEGLTNTAEMREIVRQEAKAPR